jgi:hypothetical protein
MRFAVNGPNFPDELLIARDEGRVVFFCGAGVSRAKAGLRDFVGLAQDVADRLSIPADNPARLLIKAMEDFPSIPGVGSLIAADRVFGLIERDYQSRDIHRAIAASLKPGDSPDLSAHRVLLDLAKGPDGIARLITTNFDLLFEDCDRTIPVSQQPRLPDPLRSQDFRGIIHLHGLVTPDYNDAAGEGLIISSGEFGRAYLSDRWATDFIKTVLERFFVIFVGYSADDPPMQYLLEALNRSPGSFSGAYALQSGSFEDAEARWVQKGVKPIVYDSADRHSRLWDSLDLWAERARRPTEWHTALLQKALVGPERCEPYIRGQIAHLASTLDGSKRIAQTVDALPAEWLCTFDPRIRLAKPDRTGRLTQPGPYFFPFAAYGLDSDPVPPNVDPEENSIFQKYEIPSNAWNAFLLTRADRQDLQEDQVSSVRGHWAVNVPRLSPRAAHLGRWLQRVAHQPTAIWWAASQHGIHPDIQRQIDYSMERANSGSSPLMRKAWRYLIRSWRTGHDEDHSPDYYQLVAAIKLDGWSPEMVREYARVHQPFVKVSREYSNSPRPPEKLSEGLSDLMHLDVKYPNHDEDEDATVPDKLLSVFVREWRLNLELGVALETELGAYGLHSLDPVESDDEEADPSDRDYKYGINIPLFKYLKYFRRLLESDASAARLEALAWRNADGAVAAHFKIWSCNDRRLVSGREIATVFRNISREEFWAGSHQRDLLLALKKRWQELPSPTKRSIERRLLQGRKRWKHESTKDYRESKASAILGRVHYLHLEGCEFSFDIAAVTRQLQADYPDWKPEWAAKAAFSTAMRTGWVTADKNSDDLQDKSLNEILDAAAKLSGRSADEMFVERDPYGGLCEAKPVRAFAALSVAAKAGKYPKDPWQTFLNSENSKRARVRFVALIAGRLSRLPDEFLATLIRPVSDWMLRTYKTLLTCHRDVLDALWARVVALIKRVDNSAESSVIRTNQQPDWATDALNSPVGYLAQVLIGDPAIKGLKADSCFPDWWKARADELLSLSGNHRRHALAIFCHNLVWLFFIDPDWVVTAFLPAIDRDDPDSDAFWAGFFWGAKVPQRNLYLRMKPALLRLAHKGSDTRRKHAEILAGIILAGWGRKKGEDEARLISDNELTAVLLDADDDFRVQLLWHLENWTKQPESDWIEDAAVLLKLVWPKQIAAKTSRVSAKLVELAFSQGSRFPLFADYVLPLVVPIDQDYIRLPIERTDSDLLVETYPEPTLALLDAVLTDNARQWPYGVSEILDRIAKANPQLLTDSRLIRLNRVRASF